MSEEHAASPRTYFIIFGILMLLTVTTILVAEAPLGNWHMRVALMIAVTKATLVVLFFMHVLHGTRLTWVVVGGSLLWLTILLVLTLSDYLTRGWLSS